MNRIRSLALTGRATLLLVLPAILPLTLAPAVARAEQVDVQKLTRTIRQVGPKGAGHAEAQAAWQQLVQADLDQLTDILTGMDGSNVLAVNWLRSAVETVAQRHVQQGARLPVDALEKFLQDTDREPRARRLAYELIAGVDATARERLIPGLLNDPSLELRRDAVEMALDKAAGIEDKERAILAYRDVLSAARDLDQIKTATDKLTELGDKVDLPRHFGFLMSWHLAAPFDNAETKGFDVAYKPEKEVAQGKHQVSLTEPYAGKDGDVKWVAHTTGDSFGIVDLNETLGKHKGAIAYAYTEFQSADERDVELRLGCINGNKVWLNGELVIANHVYHANMQIDQYAASCRLKKGRNTILVKIAQNEQEEPWAQRWQFQLRVCDKYGTAVLSQDRPLGQTALLLP